MVPPINLSSTFRQTAVNEHQGFDYSRAGNPTRAAYEECVASLEGAAHGFAFASGMAAEDAVLRLLAPGERVLLPDDAYGGTFRLVARVLGPAGLEYSVLDHTDLGACERDWPDGTSMVWIETPTNPALAIVDIAALADLAHTRGARVVVDNTFATPYLQLPLALGADVVVHSATKYLGGHSDVIGGFAATSDPEIAERARVPAEGGRRGAEPVRLLPRAARASRRSRCAWIVTARTRARSRSCSTRTPRCHA